MKKVIPPNEEESDLGVGRGAWIEVEEGTTFKALKSRLCVPDFVTYVLILMINLIEALPQPPLESQRKFITE